jgi:isopenicillin-N N-acyltransferase-like protein
MMRGVPFVQACGSPFAVGYEHGNRLGHRLRDFLADGRGRLDRLLPTPMPAARLRALLDEYADAIRTATPRLFAEIEGLAAGAGVPVLDAVLLQVRRELLGYQRVPTMGDCTTYARVGAEPGGTALAQTVDLTGDLDDVLGVLRVAAFPAGPATLVLSFGGLLGYLGLNSRGLAVGLNLVLGGPWAPGLPPYLAIRHVLDTAGDVDEAIEVLSGLPLASSRAFTLCDAARAATVEVLANEHRVRRGPTLTHTNHFLDPGFVDSDELNVFARNSSLQRLQAVRAGVAQLPADATQEEHFALLCTRPICVPGRGDIRAERTVAAVVMYPATGTLHVRPGDPNTSRTLTFGVRSCAAT